MTLLLSATLNSRHELYQHFIKTNAANNDFLEQILVARP